MQQACADPVMKMKIPIIDPSNIYSSHESSAGYLSSDNSESGHQEEMNSPTADNDFSEYLWMENEEEFDKQILQQLEEEALMEHCLEVMLDHERDVDNAPYFTPSSASSGNDTQPPAWSDGQQAENGSDLCYQMATMKVQDKEEIAKQSTLNPNAAEFVPQSRTTSSPLVEKTS